MAKKKGLRKRYNALAHKERLLKSGWKELLLAPSGMTGRGLVAAKVKGKYKKVGYATIEKP